ncbi:MAG: NYN domain-containing protein [bacterium]|nr:NYN domain-containing protein [bacterium]
MDLKQEKERIAVYIDGSNFYHLLRSPKIDLNNTLKFDFKSFVLWLVKERKIEEMNYYVAVVRYTPENPKSQSMVSNQQRLFSNLEKQGFKIARGHMMKHKDHYKEKGVDVKIAVDILSGAFEDVYDTIILISSDTDLIPAIRKARQLGKRVEYVGSSYQPSFGLIKEVDETRLLTQDDLKKFELKLS